MPWQLPSPPPPPPSTINCTTDILDTNNKTPIAALQIQSGLPTIKEKIHEVQINYYAKKIRTDDTKVIEGTQWEKKINKNLETYNIKKKN